MRKSKLESVASTSFITKNRSFQILLALAFVYLLILLVQFPFLSSPSASSATSASSGDPLHSEQEVEEKFAPKRPYHLLYKTKTVSSSSSSSSSSQSPKSSARFLRAPYISGLKLSEYGSNESTRNSSELNKSVREAWELGRKLFDDLNNSTLASVVSKEKNRSKESCPSSVTLTGDEFRKKGRVMVIPCGLTLGSHITLVGRPYPAHEEYDPKISVKEGEQAVMVSQFMMELQGLNTVDGEEAPKILHFNPRLKGDWSGRPVIEQNTCYRMQWGTGLRCEGWKSRADEETGIILRNFLSN